MKICDTVGELKEYLKSFDDETRVLTNDNPRYGVSIDWKLDQHSGGDAYLLIQTKRERAET